MADLLVCRVCLATNVKLYDMYENRLVWPYEFLTGLKVQKQGPFSYRTCGVCSSQLLKWMSFRDLCHSSQSLIKFASNHKHEITVDYVRSLNLNLNALSRLTLDRNIGIITCVVEDHQEVKKEIKREKIKKEEINKEEVKKEEIEEEEEVKVFDNDDIVWKSTSDDEVLFEQVVEHVEIEEVVQGEDNDDLPDVEYADDDATGNVFETDQIDLLILTKEQQIEEVQARKTSSNYLNSFYKCPKCFKGFMTKFTYRNHMLRHDPFNGPIECDICHMFWPTPSALRTHVAAAHERKYICRLCSLVSKSKHKAIEHLKWHTGHTFVCKICGMKFEKSTSHLSHLRIQHPSDHLCDVCGESFVSANGLKMHKTKTHKNAGRCTDGYACELCDSEFQSEEVLKSHVEDATDNCLNLRSCFHCGKGFSHECELKEHMKMHSEGGPTKCVECDKQFKSERKFAIHYQRVHLTNKRRQKREGTYNKPVTVCEICGKKCITNAALVYHQRMHTGEKPYHCTYCPKKFSIQQRLQIHERTHTGESPFQCAVCPKAFKHKAALNRHDRVHTGVKPYTCSYCVKSFSQSNSMKLHVKTVHLKMPAPYRNRRNQEKIS